MNDICNICIFHCNALPHTKTCSFILKPRSTTRCAVWRQLTSSCHIITIQIIGLSCIIITRSKQGSAVWRRRTSTSSRRSSSSSSSVSSLASAVCAAAGPGSLFKYHTNSLLFFMNLFLEYFTKDLINCFFFRGMPHQRVPTMNWKIQKTTEEKPICVASTPPKFRFLC